MISTLKRSVRLKEVLQQLSASSARQKAEQESPLHKAVCPDSFADTTIKRKAEAKDSSRAKKKTSTMTDHPWFVASTEAELPF
jgi:hypothetical protein